jgi:Protein of unknown function (DUF2505)
VDVAIEQRFAAPREVVEAAFCNPDFIARLADLPVIGEARLLDQHRADGVVSQRVHYRFTGQLSPVVTAVVDPARLTWVEETVFRPAEHRADVTIVPDHYPGRLRCSLQVRFEPDGPDGGGSRRVVTGTVAVPMPLVGRRVEAAIVSGMREQAERQVDLLAAWLATS